MKSFIFLLWTLSNLKFAITGVAVNSMKWNSRLGDFTPISELPSCEVEKRRTALQSLQLENLNFNGQPLNITYFEEFGFFHFRDNNTRATGICGDIYTLLSKILNFTLVLSKSEEEGLGVTSADGSYRGILENARLNQTDIIPKMIVYTTKIRAVRFSPVFWMTKQRIFACGQWKRNYAWMLTLFPKEIWFLIGLTILTLSFVSLATERILIRHRVGRQHRSRSYIDHLLYVYSSLCNQVNGTDSIASGSKILTYTISLFCWLTLIGYNSHLIYNMTEEKFDAPFNDLATLLENTNFHIVVVDGTVAHGCFHSPHAYAIFHRISKAKRVNVAPNLEQALRQVCFNPNKYVLLESEDTMAVMKNTVCQLIPVGLAYYLVPVASGVSRKVEKKKSLDIGIMKLNEYGIINAIKKRYMLPPKREAAYRVTDSLVIDMDRVFVIFGILCFGIFASVVICIVENMLFTFNQPKTLESLIQRLPTIHPLLVPSEYTRKRN